MSKWLKQNLNLAVIIALIAYAAMGIATAAVMRSDIDRLKQQIDGMPVDIAVLKAQNELIQKSVDRIEVTINKIITP